MLPENLVRPYQPNILLLEEWETTCNEVHADNFENAKALASTDDIAKGMVL